MGCSEFGFSEESMMASETAVVDVSDVLRRQFSQRLERYRSLVAKSVESGGSLPPTEAAEVVSLMEQLGLPGDRFERDRATLVGAGNLERRRAEILEENGKVVADVPALEAEVAELSREFVQETARFKAWSVEKQREIASRQQAIAKEQNRPRQSTAGVDAELMRLREGNPVLYRSGVTAEELPRLLGVRQATVGQVL